MKKPTRLSIFSYAVALALSLPAPLFAGGGQLEQPPVAPGGAARGAVPAKAPFNRLTLETTRKTGHGFDRTRLEVAQNGDFEMLDLHHGMEPFKLRGRFQAEHLERVRTAYDAGDVQSLAGRNVEDQERSVDSEAALTVEGANAPALRYKGDLTKTGTGAVSQRVRPLLDAMLALRSQLVGARDLNRPAPAKEKAEKKAEPATTSPSTGNNFFNPSGGLPFPGSTYGSPGTGRDAYGRQVDAWGRPVDAWGRPVDSWGRPLDERPIDLRTRLDDVPERGTTVRRDDRVTDVAAVDSRTAPVDATRLPAGGPEAAEITDLEADLEQLRQTPAGESTATPTTAKGPGSAKGPTVAVAPEERPSGAAGALNKALGVEQQKGPQRQQQTRDGEHPQLARGARGDDVKDLQARLTRAGYPLEQDGIFGPKTDEAVRRYQREHGLDDDGIAGPLTWGAITSDAPKVPEQQQKVDARLTQDQKSLPGTNADPRLGGQKGPTTAEIPQGQATDPLLKDQKSLGAAKGPTTAAEIPQGTGTDALLQDQKGPGSAKGPTAAVVTEGEQKSPTGVSDVKGPEVPTDAKGPGSAKGPTAAVVTEGEPVPTVDPRAKDLKGPGAPTDVKGPGSSKGPTAAVVTDEQKSTTAVSDVKGPGAPADAKSAGSAKGPTAAVVTEGTPVDVRAKDLKGPTAVTDAKSAGSAKGPLVVTADPKSPTQATTNAADAAAAALAGATDPKAPKTTAPASDVKGPTAPEGAKGPTRAIEGLPPLGGEVAAPKAPAKAPSKAPAKAKGPAKAPAAAATTDGAASPKAPR